MWVAKKHKCIREHFGIHGGKQEGGNVGVVIGVIPLVVQEKGESYRTQRV